MILATGVTAQAQQSRACIQLENQLASFDRGANDPARAEQLRRYEDAANRQQQELDRTEAQWRQAGCQGSGFFVLFSQQPQQCGPLNARIQQQRANLERVRSDLARLQSDSGGPERDAQRRAILAALAQNDCGPQYRNAAAPPRGSLFESLFGPGSIFSGNTDQSILGGGGFKTVCVRLCDGYYYPISFATTEQRFADDARTCQRSCPAAEVMLYSHRNPGEDMNQAISIAGEAYTSLPNAFRYRQSFDASCSCRRPGESWAQAMKHLDDQTVERGDVVVTEERARQMSLPRVDSQGRQIRPERAPPRPGPQAGGAKPPAAPEQQPAARGAEQPDPNRTVRSVGPTFIPGR